MAKKLKWEKEAMRGNVLVSYRAFATFKGEPLPVDSVTVFSKGTYDLPTAMFPRNKRLMPKRVKSLAKAKKMVQGWFDVFIKENQ